MEIHVSLSDIESTKAALRTLLPDVKSSHRIEALARGLGWGSNAALRADLARGPQERKLDPATFNEYLQAHGFALPGQGVIFQAITRAKFPQEMAAIEGVMARQPLLCRNGFRTADRHKSAVEVEAEFLASRNGMTGYGAVGEFARACAFLALVSKTPKINTKGPSSYGWKHEAERYHEAAGAPDPYVSNGMFITAALHLGFTAQRINDGPNALFDIAAPSAYGTNGQRSPSGAVGGSRRAAWRNMMVAAINEGLDQGLFGLDVGENHWPGENHTYRFTFAGRPAIANVRDAGHGELSFSVAVDPSGRAEDFIVTANAGFLAGDAFASGWLERKGGRWLQVASKPEVAVRRDLLPTISQFVVAPKGFRDNGPLM